MDDNGTSLVKIFLFSLLSITFFTLEPMRTSFSDLQARLDSSASAVRVPLVASPGGGVSDGMGSLSLEDQGAVSPGTPIVNPKGSSPKVYFPVVVDVVEDVCLSFIGQGLSF